MPNPSLPFTEIEEAEATFDVITPVLSVPLSATISARIFLLSGFQS
jgi:hypothetical protein